MRQAITENVWEQPGCELGRLLCPLNPSQARSEQGLALQHHEGGWLLPQAGFGALWVCLWSWAGWPQAAAWLCHDLHPGWETARVQSAA